MHAGLPPAGTDRRQKKTERNIYMNGYLAPLEGITTYIYRNACFAHFIPMDKYFTPFIVPAEKRPLRTRELRDVLPENNTDLPVVPQILTNGEGSPNRCATTMVMFLNNHLFSKNYGMAGAVSVFMFLICAVLCVVVYQSLTSDDDGKSKKKGR